MAANALAYAQMAEDTAKQITGSYQSWTAFLQTAARLYKYPYLEQLMIYAQRPDATACAEYGLWTEKMGRYVRRGSKGIGLVDMDGNTPHVRFVFDVSDTGGREGSRRPYLWQINEQNIDVVHGTLQIQYGADAPNFNQQLESIANRLVSEYWNEHQHDILDIVDGSFLEEYDDFNVGAAFRQAASVSVAYMLMSRCGLEPQSYFQHEDFLSIFDFNTPDAVSALGSAVSEISETVLRQIEAIVKNNERSRENERTELRNERWILDADNRAERDGSEAHREVRDASEGLSEETPSDPVQQNGGERDAATASPGDRADRTGTVGTDDDRDEQAGGPDRANESREPDGMGRQDEQPESADRGNPDGRTDLQLSEQPEEENAGGDNPPAFSLENETREPEKAADEEVDDAELEPLTGPETVTSQMSLFGMNAPAVEHEPEAAASPSPSGSEYSQEVIDEALMLGGFEHDSRLIIAAYMMKDRSDADNASFLREHYGTNGTGFFVNDLPYSIWYDSEGIRLSSGDSVHNGNAHLISWGDAARRIRELLDAGKYTSQAELNLAPIHERHELANRLIYLHGNIGKGAREGEAYQVTQIGLFDVSFVPLDTDQLYPVARVESKERLETLLAQDQRNKHLLSSATLEQRQEAQMDWQIARSRQKETSENMQQEDTLASFRPPEQRSDREKAGEPTGTEAPKQPVAQNYHITDDHLGEGGQKTKFRNNLNAIYVLKLIESENRQATPEEQEVLAKYVGWGGLPNAFDESKQDWADEYEELKNTLTPEEYSAARSSTLNAHYTSPTVIRSVYEALESMGFKQGNILEPAMGVGNFFGMLPQSMRGSKLYGIELDSITGRIAKQLYPQADIKVAGFETTDRRDFYDVAVGNVPFGNYKVIDRAYDKLGFNIHNYFFAKALDQVRPGGIVAFVTSHYTMDAKSPEVRKYLAERADLLGAIRLPNNAFKANAGTEVTSDIIFLQKRESPSIEEPGWVHLGETEDGLPINSYFVDHPEMVLGQIALDKSMYGYEKSVACLPIEGADLSEQLSEAIKHITGSYKEAELSELGEGEPIAKTIPADPNVKNFSYTVKNGEVYYRQNSVMVQPNLNTTALERVKGMVAIRDCVHELIDLQLHYANDGAILDKQMELNRLYDDFSRKYDWLTATFHSDTFFQMTIFGISQFGYERLKLRINRKSYHCFSPSCFGCWLSLASSKESRSLQVQGQHGR